MPYKQSGFTLIELLVAVTILAIVAVMGWRGLDGIVRSRDVLTADLDETRGLQLTFAQLQSDCFYNVNPLSYTNLPEGRSSWIEPQRLILLRHEYFEETAPAMSFVVYQLRGGDLIRFETVATRDLQVLNQSLDLARNPPDDQVVIVMQKGVQQIEFTGYPPSSLRGRSDSLNNPAPNPNAPNPDDKTPPNQNPPPSGNPPNGNPNQQDNNAAITVPVINEGTVTTGLQVSLKLQEHEKRNIIKIFMLGGA